MKYISHWTPRAATTSGEQLRGVDYRASMRPLIVPSGDACRRRHQSRVIDRSLTVRHTRLLCTPASDDSRIRRYHGAIASTKTMTPVTAEHDLADAHEAPSCVATKHKIHQLNIFFSTSSIKITTLVYRLSITSSVLNFENLQLLGFF